MFEVELARVKSLLEELTKRISTAESRLAPFKKLSLDCSERIRRYGSQYLLYYVRYWFRAFLGIRDECMLLLTGEIIRSYHADVNKDFIHQRSNERHYYSESCSLSACSTDGIDFEYRLLIDKFGQRSVLIVIVIHVMH